MQLIPIPIDPTAKSETGVLRYRQIKAYPPVARIGDSLHCLLRRPAKFESWPAAAQVPAARSACVLGRLVRAVPGETAAIKARTVYRAYITVERVPKVSVGRRRQTHGSDC